MGAGPAKLPPSLYLYPVEGLAANEHSAQGPQQAPLWVQPLVQKPAAEARGQARIRHTSRSTCPNLNPASQHRLLPWSNPTSSIITLPFHRQKPHTLVVLTPFSTTFCIQPIKKCHWLCLRCLHQSLMRSAPRCSHLGPAGSLDSLWTGLRAWAHLPVAVTLDL